MTEKEMFDKIRQCIMFANNTRPYVTTDAESFDLLDFLTELETTREYGEKND